MHVAFVNENALGHGSYLIPFVRELQRRPELGLVPSVIDATPLPPVLHAWANSYVRGLRKWGLDFGTARWRQATSYHVRRQLLALHARAPLDAIVVNTQSVGLGLSGLVGRIPVLVALDATFEQLARSAWFAPSRGAERALPLTLAPIRGRERKLFQSADLLLPWSSVAERSLIEDYGVPSSRICRLPPSIAIPEEHRPRTPSARHRILFLGGDFYRKGGDLLRKVFLRQFAQRCELHLVTQSEIEPSEGIFVHRQVRAHSAEWHRHWREADVFVFPSQLETFGIVLVEALGFQVPVVSSTAGAAREILADGRAGLLVEKLDEEGLATAIDRVFSDPIATAARVELGRRLVEQRFDLGRNTETLARMIVDVVQRRRATALRQGC